MQSCHDPVPVITVKAWVLPIITADLPSQKLKVGEREGYSHLKLADPSFGGIIVIRLSTGVG